MLEVTVFSHHYHFCLPTEKKAVDFNTEETQHKRINTTTREFYFSTLTSQS